MRLTLCEGVNKMSVNHLTHHGILGQKWGVRRFQNPDGSLTSAGKERYKSQLQADIASAAKKKGRNFASTTFTNTATSSIAINVKTKDSGVKDAAKTLQSLGKTISGQYDEIYKVAKDEALKALKDPNFKNDLDKKLYEMFGDGCDDEEFFDWERSTAVMDLISSSKYSPETAKRVDEAKKSIEQYYEICKQEAKRITDGYGSETVASVKDTAIKYEDVVTDMIHRAANSSWVSYLYRHGEDYLYEGVDEVYDPSVYPMEEYNKKHS